MNNIELKYEVALTAQGTGSVEQKILTPFDVNFSDIKQIFIEQIADNMKRISIYPNGCVVYFEQGADYARIRTNWPIAEDENGNLVIIEQKE